MGEAGLTPILKDLIVASSGPLRALETGHFAQKTPPGSPGTVSTLD